MRKKTITVEEKLSLNSNLVLCPICKQPTEKTNLVEHGKIMICRECKKDFNFLKEKGRRFE